MQLHFSSRSTCCFYSSFSSLTEFIELLTVLSPKTKASHVEEGFGLIDKNHDGSIDFDEFLEWWQQSWWEY